MNIAAGNVYFHSNVTPSACGTATGEHVTKTIQTSDKSKASASGFHKILGVEFTAVHSKLKA